MKRQHVAIKTAIPGPNSNKLAARRSAVVSSGISSGGVFVDSASGAMVTDVDGNQYLDFISAIGVQNIGHCDPEVVAAINKQAGQNIHTCSHVMMHEGYVELAEALCQLPNGSGDNRVMFANSGAEAVENAVKIARRATGKTGVVALDAAFHGRTFMTMSLTAKVKPYKNQFGPFMSDVHRTANAFCYRCPFGAQYPSCGLACAEHFRTRLKTDLQPESIAVLIAEPVQGEGGFIIPPKEFLPALADICHENNILFVADEIQSGFGRTGKMLAQEHSHVRPDMTTLSKALAAGVPLSAVVGRAEVMNAPDPGSIGGTYGGSPLGCAASLAVIHKMQRDDIPSRAAELGDIALKRLHEMAERYPVIGDVRGLGLMLGIEFVKDRITKEPEATLPKKIIASALQKGLMLLGAGMFGNIIRLLPSLTITESQLTEGLDILEESLSEVMQGI